MRNNATPYQPVESKEEYFAKYSDGEILILFSIRKDSLDPLEREISIQRYHEFLEDYQHLFGKFKESTGGYTHSRRSSGLTPLYNQNISQASSQPSSTNLLQPIDKSLRGSPSF